MSAPPEPLRWLWLGTVDYRRAWALQRRLADAIAARRLGACVLLLEHPPTYTLGRNAQPRHLGVGAERLRRLGAEVLEVDRGGSVTFHGPGQLVAYPILRLADAFPTRAGTGPGDVIRYVRALERAVIEVVAARGIAAGLRRGYTGAWVGDDKLAAIGVKLGSGGVTQHGMALNVSVDLSWFDHVVPCGIDDGGVTSMLRLAVGGCTAESLAEPFAAALAGRLGRLCAPDDGRVGAAAAAVGDLARAG